MDVAVVEQHRPVAVLLDRAHVVGDQDHGAVGAADLVEDVLALLLEGGVADRQHLVDQQDVGVGLDHDREGEAHQHPRGVVLELQVGELLELCELDHRLEAALRVVAAEAHQDPVEDHVLARGQLGVEADPELDERGDPARPCGSSPRRRGRSGEDLQQGRLAGPVAPDDPEELAAVDLEGDVAKRLEARVTWPAASGCRTRSLIESTRCSGIWKRLDEVADLDRQRPILTVGSGALVLSAKRSPRAASIDADKLESHRGVTPGRGGQPTVGHPALEVLLVHLE